MLLWSFSRPLSLSNPAMIIFIVILLTNSSLKFNQRYLFFSVREKLQDIMRDKKNRRWTILEALKDVMHSITTRFRGGSKPGVSLDKVVDLLEDHEVRKYLSWLQAAGRKEIGSKPALSRKNKFTVCWWLLVWSSFVWLFVFVCFLFSFLRLFVFTKGLVLCSACYYPFSLFFFALGYKDYSFFWWKFLNEYIYMFVSFIWCISTTFF